MSRSAAHWSIFTPICPNAGALRAGLRPLKLKWGIILKRIFLIVLDSMGVGAMPDAKDFGDEGASTIGSISKSKEFHAETLLQLGLGNIDGLAYLGPVAQPGAAVGRLAELSRGKDTTVGHWEIAGVVSPRPMPLYPNGFPQDVIDAFEKATGRRVLCNKPYSGTEVIKDYGEEHLRTGALIVYTSGDSVFQIAAHEDIVPPEQLYEYCRIARKLMVGDHGVGRIIARPFTGTYPFVRTPRRHDYSIEPPETTMLDTLKAAGKDVIYVGKISDIFAGRGVTEGTGTTGNANGMEVTLQYAQRPFEGLCFVNLVDFDSLYGHRNDVDGYARALAEFDRWLPELLKALGPEDAVMITADHGCDPGDVSTDHTREYIPILVAGPKIQPVNLGTRVGFCDIAATVVELLGVEQQTKGKSFAKELLKEAGA